MVANAINLIVQGDVFLTPCKIPEGAKKLEHRVLAKGEATGHAHVADRNAELYEAGGILYLKVADKTTVTHQEHKPITVPTGDWEVGIVKEYDPFLAEARNVKD